MESAETLSKIASLTHDGVELNVQLEFGTWTCSFSDGVVVKNGQLCKIRGSGGGLVEWPLTATSWKVGNDPTICDTENLENLCEDCPALSVIGTIPTLITSPNHENKQRMIVRFVIFNKTLLWKVRVEGFDKDCNLDSIQIFDGEWKPFQSREATNCHVHINGWQSWSYCGSLPCSPATKQPDIALPNMFSAAFHNRMRGRKANKLRKEGFGSNSNVFEGDMFLPVGFQATNETIVGTNKAKMVDSMILFGFLSQKKQFGEIRVDSTSGGQQRTVMQCECDGILVLSTSSSHTGSIETDWACIMHRRFTNDWEWVNWNEYLDLVSQYCQASLKRGERIGWKDNTGPLTWCSWYKFGPKINSSLLLAQASEAKNRDFRLFLIDDGWSPCWGDWEFTAKDDETKLCEKIKRDGNMTPGLWMAPFAADFKSSIVQRRPDLILRNGGFSNSINSSTSPSSSPCSSAYPGKFFVGLDATHPDVLYHVESSIAARSRSFSYLKLDFLYSAVLRDYKMKSSPNNRFDPTKTRAEAMQLAMEAMRRGAGEDVFLLGCGCPIGSAIGHLDGMRFGADVGHTWAPSFPLPWWDKTNLPCMRNSVRDVLCRSPMSNRWFIGDPDCILLSSPGLSEDEIQSLASVSAVLGGLVTVSDDLLLNKTSERFEIAQRIFPTLARPFDALDIMTSEIPELFLLRMDERDKQEESNSNNDNKILLVCFNWSEKDGKQVDLQWSQLFKSSRIPDVVHTFEFWTSKCGSEPIHEIARNHFQSGVIPHHGVRIFTLIGTFREEESTPVASPHAFYLGSDIHFGGKELKQWHVVSPFKFEFEICTFRKSPLINRLWIAVPDGTHTATVSGETVVSVKRTHSKSVYYEIQINGSGSFVLELSIDA